MFIAGIFVTAGNWRQPQYLSISKMDKHLFYKHRYVVASQVVLVVKNLPAKARDVRK